MNTVMTRKVAIGLLLAAGVGAGIWWAMAPKKMTAAERYATAAVERGAITQTVSANGTLNPVVLVSVGSQISGIVEKLYADFNDKVKAGQVLLELDPALTRAQLEQSEASLASARASLVLAKANEARSRDLYAQQYVTRQDLDTSIQAFKAAEAQVALAEAQVSHDRTNLNYTVIRSPVSGVVVSRDVDVGQTVAASFQTPELFKIAQDLSKMQIDSSYAEADVGSIRVGQHATFRVDAFPNRTFHGVVHQVRLNPTTQQNVVTYDVVITVDNADKVLMPGMTAYVNIAVAHRQEALLVPNAALRFHPPDAGQQKGGMRKHEPAQEEGQGGGTPGMVYVLENDQLKPVRVTIGITDSRMSEVLGNNLKPGDKVIVSDRQATEASGSHRGMRLF
jgi:HlyD family secretion protein